MKRPLIFTLFFLALGLFFNCANATSENKENMKAGISKIDMTPPIGYPVHKRPSIGALDPLEIKTMVLNQGNANAALVFADLFYIPFNLSSTVRKLASEKTGIPVSNICIAATHTHADPSCFDEVDDYIQKMSENKLTQQDKDSYAGQLISKLVQSVVDAQANLKPVNLQSGIAKVEGLTFNRRHLLKNGIVVMNGGFQNPDILRAVGPIDPDFGIVLLNDKETNSPYASLSTFATQLGTIGDAVEFSSDFPHFIETTLQNEFGEEFISIFGEGACADVNHWDITKPGPQVGYEETTKPIGEKLGSIFLDAIPEFSKLEENLAVANKVVQVPLQTYSEMDLEWAKNFNNDSASFIVKTRVRRILLLEELRSKQGDTLPMEIQAFKLNNETVIVTFPGQMFVELNLDLKENSPFKNTHVITLANDQEDCLPTRKSYTEGSYEVIYSVIESGGGEMLVETALSLLDELK